MRNDEGLLRLSSRVDAFRLICEMVAKRTDGALIGALREADGTSPSPLFRRACDVFERSLIGSASPSFWIEAPLVGEPGFDVHVYFDRPYLPHGARFAEGAGFGCQPVFDWFIDGETGGIGLGFAHDLSSDIGPDEGVYTPALYVNVYGTPLNRAAGFFESAGWPEAASRYERLLGRLPAQWRVWYMGLFAGRPKNPVRAGCLVPHRLTNDYAHDVAAFARQLDRAGFAAYDTNMLAQIGRLAQLPFDFELQFDMLDDGRLSPTLSLSLMLSNVPSIGPRQVLSSECGQELCALLREWGVADERTQPLQRVPFGRLIPGEWGSTPTSSADAARAFLISCVPAFIKVKWTDCRIQPAKVYLTCASRFVSQG